MTKYRKIQKTIYTFTVITAIVTGLFGGFTSAEPSREFYREPYAAKVFPTVLPKKASDFTDVKDTDWFYVYVDTLVNSGVLNGKSETEFDPYGTLTVAECSAILVRTLGLEKTAAEFTSELSEGWKNGEIPWYAGYLKLCIDLGIAEDNKYGFGYVKDGAFSVYDRAEAERPIKRYELAEFVAEMCSLDGSIRAANTYSERGGLGHEFIRGGMYDLAVLDSYIPDIPDYMSIPKGARESVLRLYYNGIVSGDENGNFFPENSLTRAEMAKVAAVLADSSLRFGEDHRSEAVGLSEKDFTKDAEGRKILKKEAGFGLLQRSAEKLSVNDGVLSVPLYSVAPCGYISEAHIFTDSDDGYSHRASITPGTEGSEISGAFAMVDISDAEHTKVIYILRNISCGGEVEGVLEADISPEGTEYIHPLEYPEIPVKDEPENDPPSEDEGSSAELEESADNDIDLTENA